MLSHGGYNKKFLAFPLPTSQPLEVVIMLFREAFFMLFMKAEP
jgi:hypothetical protein